MSDKLTIFIAVDNDSILAEIQPLIDQNKFRIENFKSENKCIESLHLKPDILLIDYHLNNNSDSKEKKSIEIIEKIKENKLQTKIFMFSTAQSVRIYLEMLNNNI